MVICELDSTSRMEADGSVGGEGSKEPLLLALYKFCSEATDLVRAFLLAALCRDAVSIATKKKEAKTYGIVCSADSGNCLELLKVTCTPSILLTKHFAPL